MSDLIRREDAIDAIESTDWYHINRNGEMVHGANDELHQAWQKADEIHKAIESIPSAERKGRNLLVEYPSLFECSECGTSCHDTMPWDCNINYCPYCGAKIGEERKGEWIIEKAYCDYYKYRCSNCDYYEIRPYSDCDTFNYCPNCGCRMKGAEDE